MANEALTPHVHAARIPAIVLIEHDLLMRRLLKEWLTAAGYSVREAPLRHGTNHDGIDLIIVDVYMPRESGARIIRAVQRAYPGAPIIAISGQFRPGLAHSGSAARALGARRLLPKPFSREDLLSTVRDVIEQSE